MITINDLIEKAFSEGYEYAYEERYFADTKKSKEEEEDERTKKNVEEAIERHNNKMILGGLGIAGASYLGGKGLEKAGDKLQDSRKGLTKVADVFRREGKESWRKRLGSKMHDIGRIMQFKKR